MIVLLVLFSLFTIPAFAQESTDDYFETTILVNTDDIENHVVSKILEIPGLNINSNGTISLNVTLNAIVEIEEKKSQCELLDNALDECELFSKLYYLLEDELKNRGEKDVFDMFMQVLNIVLPVAAGIGGLLGGRYLSDRAANKKEVKDLEKIRRLINLDFSRIYHMKKYLEKMHKQMNLDLKNWESFVPFITDRYKMKELMMSLHSDLKFYHKNTLENSASLIKLEDDEIQRIQFAYDQISGVEKNNSDAWLELAGKLETALEKVPDEKKRAEVFFIEVKKYLESLFVGYDTVNGAYNQLIIDWVDLDLFVKDYPNEKIDLIVENDEKAVNDKDG